MSTLIIYDKSGYIISTGTGSLREPTGIPFIWADIPIGKNLVSVNVNVTPNIPVLEDIPDSETTLIMKELAKLRADFTEMDIRTTDTAMMVLEAVASVYESVLPFLP